jgi:hypothetical protein
MHLLTDNEVGQVGCSLVGTDARDHVLTTNDNGPASVACPRPCERHLRSG